MVRVAAIQYKPPKGNLDIARAELCDLIMQAIEMNAKIIVCPEMATSGYVWESPEELLPFAESLSGKTSTVLTKLSSKHKVTIICGFPELKDNLLYNSAMICTPWGTTYSYQKILLYEADKSWSSSGNRRIILETPFGTIYPAICMDINDPSMRHSIRNEQPDIVAFCTNWIDDGELVLPYWRYMLTGYDGYFIAANTHGHENGISFSGRSVILGPKGSLLAEAPYKSNCIITAEINPAFS